MSKTLVIGASENPERYSYKAITSLRQHGHEVVAVGLKPGKVLDVEFLTSMEGISAIDTVTLYIGPKVQPSYYDAILALLPRRIIFNPGTENPQFYSLAQAQGIEVEQACTLVMLSVGSYDAIPF